MSFYVYHGKLNNELVVVVLPKGTVEVDDPVFFYTSTQQKKQQFLTYRAAEVSLTEDDNDRFKFKDPYYTYDAVSKKNYREISLSRKSITGESATMVLTRQYDQPHTAIPLSSEPRIWTGALEFHKWADKEAFIIVAPQGLGKGKPIVCIWQWTIDDKNVKKVLSFGNSTQNSDAKTPEIFSFSQNGYYTLSCVVNSATGGLGVAIKSESNAEQKQKELVLSAKVNLGAEHTFSPSRGSPEKLTFDCFRPFSKPQLPRIATPLPFPADLVETLSYSAAYVDQAGYLAKYAISQFDKLDRSYNLLEKKADGRAAKITTLEAEVLSLGEKNKIEVGKNKQLERQLKEARSTAAERETSLQAQLKEALAKLHQSEKKLEGSRKTIKTLETAIEADKLADLQRDIKHAEHEKEDHAAIDMLNQALDKATTTIRCLEEQSAQKDCVITGLETKLHTAKEQLAGAEEKICELEVKLTTEKKRSEEIREQLEQTEHKLSLSEQDKVHLRAEVKNLHESLEAANKNATCLETELKAKKGELNTKKEEYKELKDRMDRTSKRLKEKTEAFEALEKYAKEKHESTVEDYNDQILNLTEEIRKLSTKTGVKTEVVEVVV